MSDYTKIAGGVGLIAVVLYLVITLRARRQPDLATTALVFLAGTATVGGSIIIGAVFSPTTVGLPAEWLMGFGDLKLYIILGGLSTVWVSVATVGRALGLGASHQTQSAERLGQNPPEK